jgi:hypothetical protein
MSRMVAKIMTGSATKAMDNNNNNLSVLNWFCGQSKNIKIYIVFQRWIMNSRERAIWHSHKGKIEWIK